MANLTTEDAERLSKFTSTLSAYNSRAFLVGGCVRDRLLGNSVKDVDVEVHGMSFVDLENHLKAFFGTDSKINTHGQSFLIAAVTLPSGFVFEFGVPREEIKTGDKHNDFAVQERPEWGIEESVKRRDFTVNALMVNACLAPLFADESTSVEWVKSVIEEACQPFLKDIVFGGSPSVVLRPVSDRFVEDPLRVLRAMRFIAKLPNCAASKELLVVSRDMIKTFGGLSKERINQEFTNTFLTGTNFVAAFDFLRASGWLANFPRLNEMAITPQDPVWHPEGDVLRHTCFTMEQMAGRTDRFTQTELLQNMWALFIHDAWKPDTFIVGEDGRIHNPKHDLVAGEQGENFLRETFDVSVKTARVAAKLAELHMCHAGMTLDTSFPRAARRLASKIDGLFDPCQLQAVILSDLLGRPPSYISERSEKIIQSLFGALDDLCMKEDDAKCKLPVVVSGKDLLAAGVPQGPMIGQLLAKANEAVIEGELTESNKETWLKEILTELH